MKETQFYYSGVNGSITVDTDILTIEKENEKTHVMNTDRIPLTSVTAVQFHEGKLLGNGYLLVSTKDDPSEVSIFSSAADNSHAIAVDRHDSRNAQKFADQVEEYLYERFYSR